MVTVSMIVTNWLCNDFTGENVVSVRSKDWSLDASSKVTKQCRNTTTMQGWILPLETKWCERRKVENAEVQKSNYGNRSTAVC